MKTREEIIRDARKAKLTSKTEFFMFDDRRRECIILLCHEKNNKMARTIAGENLWWYETTCNPYNDESIWENKIVIAY